MFPTALRPPARSTAHPPLRSPSTRRMSLVIDRRRVARRPLAPRLRLAVVTLATASATAACTTTRQLPPQVVVGGSTFIVRGDAASRTAFTPDLPAPGGDFECAAPLALPDGAIRWQGWFPTREAATASVSVEVDSSGAWREIGERRGLVRIEGLARATSDSARLRLIREAEARERHYALTLSRTRDLAVARNAGGGRPDDGVRGTVEELAALPALGAPMARAEAVLARCRRP